MPRTNVDVCLCTVLNHQTVKRESPVFRTPVITMSTIRYNCGSGFEHSQYFTLHYSLRIYVRSCSWYFSYGYVAKRNYINKINYKNEQIVAAWIKEVMVWVYLTVPANRRQKSLFFICSFLLFLFFIILFTIRQLCTTRFAFWESALYMPYGDSSSKQQNGFHITFEYSGTLVFKLFNNYMLVDLHCSQDFYHLAFMCRLKMQF